MYSASVVVKLDHEKNGTNICIRDKVKAYPIAGVTANMGLDSKSISLFAMLTGCGLDHERDLFGCGRAMAIRLTQRGNTQTKTLFYDYRAGGGLGDFAICSEIRQADSQCPEFTFETNSRSVPQRNRQQARATLKATGLGEGFILAL